MLLSVIVPVYNVENYIFKCLQSLVDEEIFDVEIIVVDDGSTDNSFKIAKEFELKYPNKIKVYQKNNGGLSDARNFGLNYAKGDYITFIDSDDYLEKGFYQNNISKLKEGYDLIIGDIRYVYSDPNKNFVSKGLNQNSSDDFKKSLFLSPLFAHNKIYHKKFFKEYNFRFPLGLNDEDTIVSLLVFVFAEKVYYYDKVSLNYVQREGSIMNSKFNPKMFDIFTIFDLVIAEFKKYNIYDLYFEELEYLAIENMLYYGAFRFLRSSGYKQLLTKSFDYLKAKFPNHLKNKYLKQLSFKNRVFVYTLNKYSLEFWRVIISGKN